MLFRSLEKAIQIEEIPKLDLYMDQVIQMFENRFKDTARNDKEKVLTKTMVNNYGKDKLFYPIEKKKYTRNHVMLIAMIYHLKGSISIPDIKLTLHELNERAVSEEINLQEVYEMYLNIHANNAAVFVDAADAKREEILKKLVAEGIDDHYIGQLLLILNFVQMSTMYRKLAENLIDEL